MVLVFFLASTLVKFISNPLSVLDEEIEMVFFRTKSLSNPQHLTVFITNDKIADFKQKLKFGKLGLGI